MQKGNRTRLAALLGLAAVAAVTFVTAATAGQPFRETVHVEASLEVENFCDVEGMTVQLDRVLDMRVTISARGREGLAYFLQHGTIDEVMTFEGTSISSHASVIEKDLRVTDNGDGTLTVLILSTGNAVLYGPNGEAIARNPGQTRFELVLDDGGTPTDPFDDVELDFRVVKESTGRSDDFCTAAVAALS